MSADVRGCLRSDGELRGAMVSCGELEGSCCELAGSLRGAASSLWRVVVSCGEFVASVSRVCREFVASLSRVVGSSGGSRRRQEGSRACSRVHVSSKEICPTVSESSSSPPHESRAQSVTNVRRETTPRAAERVRAAGVRARPLEGVGCVGGGLEGRRPSAEGGAPGRCGRARLCSRSLCVCILACLPGAA